jgi:tetratricopeptide (TPR) repeat protein
MRRLLALAVCVVLSAGGCKTLDASGKEVQEQRKRNQETVRDLDQRRDAAELLLARERFEQGELEQARQTLTRLLGRSPGNTEAKNLLAAVERTQQQTAPSAVVPTAATGLTPAIAEQIGTEVPTAEIKREGGAVGGENTGNSGPADQVRSLLANAETALREKNEQSTATALGRIQAARAVNPQDPQIPISAAALLLRYNQPQAAIGILREASGAFPTSAAVHRMLGTAHYRAGDYQASQVALQQALSLDKSSALSYFLMGCTLAKLGRTEEAATHFRQAQTLDPRYAAER